MPFNSFIKVEHVRSPSAQTPVHIWWHKADDTVAGMRRPMPVLLSDSKHWVRSLQIHTQASSFQRTSGCQSSRSASEEKWAEGKQPSWIYITAASGQEGGFACRLPLHHEHVKISWHHLVSSHSVRWRSSGNYIHLHVLI